MAKPSEKITKIFNRLSEQVPAPPCENYQEWINWQKETMIQAIVQYLDDRYIAETLF